MRHPETVVIMAFRFALTLSGMLAFGVSLLAPVTAAAQQAALPAGLNAEQQLEWQRNAILLAREQARIAESQTVPPVVWLVAAMLFLFMIGGGWLVYQLGAKADAQGRNPPGTRDRWFDLPLGAPDGSVRALISIFIVIFGFLLLALQSRLGLSSGEAVAGFIGAVISFYFASRNTEQARQAADSAATAAQDAKTAADRAGETARNVGTQMQASTTAISEELRRRDVSVGVAASSVAAQPVATPQTEDVSLLARAGQLLGTAREVTRIAASLAPGATILQGTAAALEASGVLVQRAEVALQSGDPRAIAAAASAANDALRVVVGRDNPATEVIADAIGGFQLGSSALALLGISGPAGLVAALAVGAFQAAEKGNEYFERWKARVLDTRYTTRLFSPGPVDGAVARSVLEQSPIFRRVLWEPLPEAQRFSEAAHIVTLAKQQTPASRDALLAMGHFASEDEFDQGLQELLARLLDNLLKNAESDEIDITRLGFADVPKISNQTLRDSLAVMRQDPQTRDLDTLILLVTRLASSGELKREDVLNLLSQQIQVAGQVAAEAAPKTISTLPEAA
jgi:hypothetical protein